MTTCKFSISHIVLQSEYKGLLLQHFSDHGRQGRPTAREGAQPAPHQPLHAGRLRAARRREGDLADGLQVRVPSRRVRRRHAQKLDSQATDPQDRAHHPW
jgi:hypothetical protein